MLEQRGSFSGLNTCNNVEFGNFDKYSQLRFDVERRAIHNRFDIDDHLSVFCNNNIISEVQASDMREDADNFCSISSLFTMYRISKFYSLKYLKIYFQNTLAIISRL